MSFDINALPGNTYRPNRLNSYLQVLHALMLRDMRNRFMASYWGWGVQVMWPVVHMFIIGGAMTFQKVPSPMGKSTMLFVATGAVPALTFQYISREMMKGILMNKPLTYYPHVKDLDVILARMLVEIVGSFGGLLTICLVLLFAGIDPIPVDITTALIGYFVAIILGIGIGSINAAIVSAFPGWVVGYALFSIITYVLSGVMFMPVYLPEQAYNILKWNPILQVVEWVRLGYDPSIPVKIDYLYLVFFAVCSLIIGLLLERYITRHRNA